VHQNLELFETTLNEIMGFHPANEIEALDRRAKAMAERNAERLPRFLDSKARTIGVDAEALAEQLEEKRLINLNEELRRKDEAEAQEILLMNLRKLEFEIQGKKRAKEEEIQATLAEQISRKQNSTNSTERSLDSDSCGPSALQKFEGEDPHKKQREEEKRNQVKNWCAEQVSEKERKRREDMDAKRLEGLRLAQEVERRRQMEESLANARAQRLREIQMENIQRAKELELSRRNSQQKRHYEEQKIVENMKRDPFLTENGPWTSAQSPHRVRPDHYKGFDEETTKQFLSENDTLLEAKRDKEEDDMIKEQCWIEAQRLMTANYDMMTQRKQDLRNQDNMIHVDTLKRQQMEAKERHDKERDRIFGTIKSDFFDQFGKSCR